MCNSTGLLTGRDTRRRPRKLGWQSMPCLQWGPVSVTQKGTKVRKGGHRAERRFSLPEWLGSGKMRGGFAEIAAMRQDVSRLGFALERFAAGTAGPTSANITPDR